MLPNEIVTQMKHGDVVLFIGAGLSMNAGLPSWVELAHTFAGAINFHWPASEDITTEHLLTAFQYFDNQYGRNELLRTMRSKLETTASSPAIAHYLIPLLPVQTIFTTNYDDLLERAYRDVMQPVHVVVNPLELAYSSQGSAKIVKLCGDLARPESIVITKSDFNVYPETHQRLIEQLRTTLETRTALFLGYSLRDPFINQIWDAIHLTQGEHHRMAYAVIFNASSLEVDDLRRRGIHVVQPIVESSIEKAFLDFMAEILKALGPQLVEEKIQNALTRLPTTVAAQMKQLYEHG